MQKEEWLSVVGSAQLKEALRHTARKNGTSIAGIIRLLLHATLIGTGPLEEIKKQVTVPFFSENKNEPLTYKQQIRCSTELKKSVLNVPYFLSASETVRYILYSFLLPAGSVVELRNFLTLKHQSKEVVSARVLSTDPKKKILFRREMENLGVIVQESLFGRGTDRLEIPKEKLQEVIQQAHKQRIELLVDN